MIPPLTSTGENKMLGTENISHLKRKEETRISRHLFYSVHCISIKTLVKAIAVTCKEKLSVKAFLLPEVRCSLPLET